MDPALARCCTSFQASFAFRLLTAYCSFNGHPANLHSCLLPLLLPASASPLSRCAMQLRRRKSSRLLHWSTSSFHLVSALTAAAAAASVAYPLPFSSARAAEAAVAIVVHPRKHALFFTLLLPSLGCLLGPLWKLAADSPLKGGASPGIQTARRAKLNAQHPIATLLQGLADSILLPTSLSALAKAKLPQPSCTSISSSHLLFKPWTRVPVGPVQVSLSPHATGVSCILQLLAWVTIREQNLHSSV